MQFVKTLSTVIVLALPMTTALHAEGDAAAAVKERQAHFKALGKNIGVVGDMAAGKTDYDAAAALAAATELVRLANVDQSGFWVEGTDVSFGETRALPALFNNLEDVKKLNANLASAAATLEVAAGTDLAAIQAAIGPVGEACGACHKLYRQPK